MVLDLTLIIPCYNESVHIQRSLLDVMRVLGNTNLDYEVVLIDDRSQDDTLAKLTCFAADHGRIVVKHNERNLGRGGTVSRGIRESQARVVGFLDIDLSTQPVYVPYLTGLILEGIADVATCRRTYKIELRVLHRTFHRIILSHGYRRLSRWLLGHSLKDTETGFKFFDREKILPVLGQVEDQYWFWDTEIMVRSVLAGLRIVEVDSIFVRRPEKPSTVRIFRDVKAYLRNLFRFRKALRQSKRSWRNLHHG